MSHGSWYAIGVAGIVKDHNRLSSCPEPAWCPRCGTIIFMSSLIEEVYQRPANLSRFREQRQRRAGVQST